MNNYPRKYCQTMKKGTIPLNIHQAKRKNNYPLKYPPSKKKKQLSAENLTKQKEKRNYS
jgi:hypothetical protein